MFDSLEERLHTLKAKISKKLDKLESESITLEDKNAMLNVIAGEIPRMNSTLRQLEIELKSLSILVVDDDIESQRSRIQLETSNVMLLNEKFNVIKEKIEREILLGKRANENANKQTYDDSLTDNSSRLHVQNNTLSNAKQNILQTEAVAEGIAYNLQSNREKIESAGERAGSTARLLGQGEGLLNNMLRRENRRALLINIGKYCLGLIFFVFIFKNVLWISIAISFGAMNDFYLFLTYIVKFKYNAALRLV